MLMLLLKESIRSPREVLGANMKVRVTRCLSIVSMGVRQIVRGLGNADGNSHVCNNLQ